MGDPYAALGQVVTPTTAAQPPAQGADPYAQLGEQQSAAPASPDANSNKMRDHVQQLIDTGANQDEIETYVRSVGIDPGRITGLKEALVARGMGAHPEVKLQDLVAGKPPAQVGVREAGTEDTGFLHHAAIVGKGIVQGLSDFNDMMPWSGAAFAHNLGAPSHSEIFDAQLEHAGVAQAQTRGQRIEESAARGVGSALPLGPAAPGAAALNAFAGASAGGAGQLAKEEGYGPGVQFAASLAAGGAPYALKGGVNAFASRAAAARPPVNAMVADAAAQEGIPISRPYIDSSVRNAVTALETTKGGGPVVHNAMSATSDAIRGKVATLGGPGTALDPLVAGEKIQEAGRASIAATGKEAKRLYTAADTLAGPVTLTPTNALASIDAHLATLKQAPNTNKAVIDYLTGLRADLAKPGGLSIQTLRDIRSGIRGQISAAGLTQTNAERLAGEALSGASKDIDAALASNKPAQAAFAQADKYWAQRQENIRNVLQRFLGRRDTPLSAEQAFSRFQAMATPKGDSARLAAMMKTLPPDDQADIAATFADNLGKGPKGFSPALLVSQAAKLSREARLNLFGPQGAASLDRLIAVATEHAAIGTNLNNSRSGVAVNYRSWLPSALGMMTGGASLFEHGVTPSAITGAGTAAVASAGQTLANRLSARALMNPDISKWLRSAPATATPAAIARHIATLSGVAAANPSIAGEVNALRTNLMNAANENFPHAAAASDQQQQNKQ